MWVLLMGVCRSMVYVEGEASMRKFQREEGVEQNALSIVQRLYSAKQFFYPPPIHTHF